MTSFFLSSNHTLCHISCMITVVLSFDTDCLYKSIAKNGSTNLSVPDCTNKYGFSIYLNCLAKFNIAVNITNKVLVHIPYL